MPLNNARSCQLGTVRPLKTLAFLAFFACAACQPQPATVRADAAAFGAQQAALAGQLSAKIDADLALELQLAGNAALDCAIYVEKRWSAAQIAVFAQAGLAGDLGAFVDAVPTHGHLHGFYVAGLSAAAAIVVARDTNTLRIGALHYRSRPQNDLGRALIHAGQVALPSVGLATGAGVKICIADSGLDTKHPDIPKPIEAFDVTKGKTAAEWPTDVHNKVSPHGTHVTGSAVGSGAASAGLYRGTAPQASLYFYKIGDDVDASASPKNEIKAMQRAHEVGCQIFSMSYGSVGDDVDGAGPLSQAVDALVASGTTAFVSAGNAGNDFQHAVATLAPGQTKAVQLNVVNPSATKAKTEWIRVKLWWRDALPQEGNISVEVKNAADAGEAVFVSGTVVTARATEGRTVVIGPNLKAKLSKNYSIVLHNTSLTAATTVHLYVNDEPPKEVGFDAADLSTVVGTPAIADSAIAVAAWTDRVKWTSFKGQGMVDKAKLDQIAPYSSHGPRIDGLIKPDLAAAGTYVISARDADVSFGDDDIIDDDGKKLDGSGPAHYAVMKGTSMATPMAAGAAALLLQADPTLSPSALRDRLQQSASGAGKADSSAGYGIIDAKAASNLACAKKTCLNDYPGQCGIALPDGCSATVDCTSACTFGSCVLGQCSGADKAKSVCAACLSNNDCLNGFYCSGNNAAKADSPSTCLPLCATATDCPDGTICDNKNGGCYYDTAKIALSCNGDNLWGTDSCGQFAPRKLCGAHNTCKNNVCVCKPACEGRACGDDGCGGVCGSCGFGQKCNNGACIGQFCLATAQVQCDFTTQVEKVSPLATDVMDAWICGGKQRTTLGPERAFDFSPPCTGTAHVNLEGATAKLDAILLILDGNKPCIDSSCKQKSNAGDDLSDVAVSMKKGEPLRVVIDSQTAAAGTVALTLSCQCSPETDCINGVDDDKDGAIDCKDSDCAGNVACAVCTALCGCAGKAACADASSTDAAPAPTVTAPGGCSAGRQTGAVWWQILLTVVILLGYRVSGIVICPIARRGVAALAPR